MRLLDNFILGSRGGLFPDRGKAARELRDLSAQFGFGLDPDGWVDSLTVGERQQLEILRLLWFGAQVLILDEPTTGISLPQKEKLFATLKKLAAQGMTMIFVSHKLEDVESLCTQVAVLRQGALVGTAAPPYETKALVKMMFGKEVSFGGRAAAAPGPSLLCMSRVSLEGARLQLRDVNFHARAGEVIGLAGMEGSGQSLFLQACAGLARPVEPGKSSCLARRHGAVPPLRTRGSASCTFPPRAWNRDWFPGSALPEHFVLSEGARGFFIDKPAAAETAAERIRPTTSRGPRRPPSIAVRRRPAEDVPGAPSGAPFPGPPGHPTRGLDIESNLYIWAKLKERCAQGTAIVFISADLDEVLQYSDRISCSSRGGFPRCLRRRGFARG